MSDRASIVLSMAKKQDSYECCECGWTTAKWVGQCASCKAWGSIVERSDFEVKAASISAPSAPAVPITAVDAETAEHSPTGIGELDRVLGGGLVPGAVVLLAGEPGVGKSTLLLEVASRWAKHSNKTLYITGEESAAQVRLRAGRTDSLSENLYLAAETSLATVLGQIEQVRPSLLVVDSVQTIIAGESNGVPGGLTQVREITSALVRVAKQRNMAVLIVGHVTKDGNIAGPRTLEHLVDVVLDFSGDKSSGFRMVRAQKNRFGPADEVGCFEMGDHGIFEVPDPSGMFTTGKGEPSPGTCVTVAMEGKRPLLIEVQALVAPIPAEAPARRVTHGMDNSRVAMILAVLQRKAHFPLSRQDVYVSTVGGARIYDPAADLSVACAVASAALDRNFPQRVVAFGEIGLAGDLRRVPGLEKRVGEAARLGFDLALVPANNRDKNQHIPNLGGLKVVEVDSLAQALATLDLRRAR